MNATMSSADVEATIDRFVAARPDGHLPKGRWYRPNGGQATWTPDEFITEDTLDDELRRDWETAELSASGTLDLFRHDGDVLSYFSCSWAPEASGGRRRLAYLGAHFGFDWEDDGDSSQHLRSALEHAAWDDDMLSLLGLACCEDDLNGDDGGYWLVDDEAKFARVLEECRRLDEADEDGEMDGEDAYSSAARACGGHIRDEDADAPGYHTTVDQHRGDHGPTGLRITELTDVRTDYSDYFADAPWGAISDAERAARREILEGIHAATVELESLDAGDREAARERLAAAGITDPSDVARAIRDAIEEVVATD